MKELALLKGPDCKLLRIYWYDGIIGGARPSSEQGLLGHLDDVKLRLGLVNNSGQQKGVDSLIVTDLIELARLKSISEAILLAGDEDLRIGVQIAQNYGVRVHLLGIKPARGSQSLQLLQEADTTTEWDESVVESFLAVREFANVETERSVAVAARTAPAVLPLDSTIEHVIDDVVEGFVRKLSDADLLGMEVFWADRKRGVPVDFDRRLLPVCRNAIGRDLERPEITRMRSLFQSKVRALIDQKPS